MVVGGMVRTIVSTLSTGASNNNRDNQALRVSKGLTSSKQGRVAGEPNKLLGRQALATPGSDKSTRGTIVISTSLIILLFQINLLL